MSRILSGSLSLWNILDYFVEMVFHVDEVFSKRYGMLNATGELFV